MNTYRDLDPATGETIAEIPITSPADLEAAIARARAAQPSWQALGTAARLEILSGLVPALEAAAEELADLATREMGKPRKEALGEVKGWAAGITKELEEIAEAMKPESYPTKGNETQVVRIPHGVVGVITPWNFPVGMPLQILTPALATGNTVVFKPSEMVPLTGARIAEIVQSLVPEGVCELVQGEGDVGAALVAGDVDMIGFTGSRETGMRIMESASRGLKRLILELGGKDPMVVFEDADLEAAAKCAVNQSLRNAGQVCCSVERVYVADSIADQFEKLVAEKAQDWKAGSGFDESSKMGPLVSPMQREKVAVHVADAIESGARLLVGGTQPEGPGNFYPATVLADVSQDMRITREETFGPVVSLTRFSGDEAEAIALANDTPYGLGASVFSGDEDRGMRVAEALQAGQVGINRYLGGAPGTPWVGARQSGFGFLGGIEGHRQFTSPKTISLKLQS